ncbi:hypothetical protein ACQPYK_22920 [Streptosporangium sp. CA-135522]|uniref:hypothetical protein n=1 Tax=Streptosporangium sp. CA-135522 TaxID=3240072 RepID=UPI003D91020B
MADPRGLGSSVELADDALDALVQFATRDARRALTGLEAAASSALASGDTVETGAADPDAAIDAAEVSVGVVHKTLTDAQPDGVS